MQIYTETEGQKWQVQSVTKPPEPEPSAGPFPYTWPPSQDTDTCLSPWGPGAASSQTLFKAHFNLWYVCGDGFGVTTTPPHFTHELMKVHNGGQTSIGLARGASQPRQAGEKLLNNLNLRCIRIIAKRMKSLTEKEIRTTVTEEKNKHMAIC